jgi:hypothetical protein
MGRVKDGLSTAAAVAAAGVGYAVGVIFLLLIFGGTTYKTDCVTQDGRHVYGWEFSGSLPYLWDKREGCDDHTATRVLLGELGLMSKL